jgi:hypothetical protein
VINRHPQLRASLVRPTPSPFTSAVVADDIVLKSECRKREQKRSGTKFLSCVTRRYRSTRFRRRSQLCRAFK